MQVASNSFADNVSVTAGYLLSGIRDIKQQMLSRHKRQF